MALELDYETEHGLTLENAYAKITLCSFDNEWNEEEVGINHHVKIYVNESAKEEGKPALAEYDFIMPLNINNGKTQYNVLKQGYLHLKTLEGFTDATDS